MKVLALIPARGGSKGIKRKNLVPLNGKPLVSHSIKHALSCSLIDRIIVTTEDKEIKKISLDYGAEVIDRPEKLADDHVLDLPVFIHALEVLKKREKYIPDIIVQLRPTSPFRKPEWITDCIELLIKSPDADSVITVNQVGRHPYRMFEQIKGNRIQPIMNHRTDRPHIIDRHDLPLIYDYNCVIDITRPSTIYEKGCTVGDIIVPYVLDSKFCVDIDSPNDLKIAEKLFRSKS